MLDPGADAVELGRAHLVPGLQDLGDPERLGIACRADRVGVAGGLLAELEMLAEYVVLDRARPEHVPQPRAPHVGDGAADPFALLAEAARGRGELVAERGGGVEQRPVDADQQRLGGEPGARRAEILAGEHRAPERIDVAGGGRVEAQIAPRDRRAPRLLVDLPVARLGIGFARRIAHAGALAGGAVEVVEDLLDLLARQPLGAGEDVVDAVLAGHATPAPCARQAAPRSSTSLLRPSSASIRANASDSRMRRGVPSAL